MRKNLDKDRLDKNVLDAINGVWADRQSGITTAFLYMMLGEVWLGDTGNTYIYVTPYKDSLRLVMRDFIDLIENETDLQILQHTMYSIRLSNGQTYYFYSLWEMSRSDSTRGYSSEKTKVFCDVHIVYRSTNQLCKRMYEILAQLRIEIIG